MVEQFFVCGYVVVCVEGCSQEVFEKYLVKQCMQCCVVFEMLYFMSFLFILSCIDLIVMVLYVIGYVYVVEYVFIVFVEFLFVLLCFDLKQYWYCKYYNDLCIVWLCGVVVLLFNDEQDEWLK